MILRAPTSTVLGFTLGLAFLAGCAQVHVKRVKPDDYHTEGFRYYLPRPYLVVKKPFPVGSTQAFLTGTVQGSQVVEIDVSELPQGLQQRLGAGGSGKASVGLSQLLVARGTGTPDGAVLAGEQSDSSSPSPQSSEPKAEQVVVNPGWLSATVSPTILQVDSQVAGVTVVLAKEHPFTSATSAKVVLIPVATDGSVQVDKTVELSQESPPTFQGATALTYKGAATRDALKGAASYAAAIRVVGQQSGDTKDKTYVAYVKGTSLVVVGNAEAKPGAKKETKTAKGTESKTKATATLSGDPATDPLQKVSDLFDVLYLPDFDQQYAVSVEGKLGTATLDLGLENGWMVESAKVSLDNSKIGEFLFEQVEKVTDLATDLVRVNNGLLAPLGDEEEEAVEQSMAGRKVLLKLTYLKEAQPGLYPILKPGESIASVSHPWLFLPNRPYTVIAFNTAETLLIELVTAVATVAEGQGRGQEPTKLATGAVASVLNTLASELTAGSDKPLKDAIEKVSKNLDVVKLAEGTLELHLRSKLSTNEIGLLGPALNAKAKRFDDKFVSEKITAIKVVPKP